MSPLQVAKLVAVMLAAYPNTKAVAGRAATSDATETFGTSEAYERMLVDLDYAVANAAIEQLIATTPRFMPTVAEIRERVQALETGDMRAGGEAWGSVRRAIGKAGRYRRPGVDFTFYDPVTAETVASMNWVDLCDSENIVADRARFIELYDQLAIRHRRAQLSEGLPAMQRFRALQAAAARAPQLKRGSEPRTLGQLLQFLPPGGDA